MCDLDKRQRTVELKVNGHEVWRKRGLSWALSLLHRVASGKVPVPGNSSLWQGALGNWGTSQPCQGFSVGISCAPPGGYRTMFADGSMLEAGWCRKSCSAASKATGCVLGCLDMTEMEFLAHSSAVGQRDGLFFFPKLFATPFPLLFVLLKQWALKLCSRYLVSQRKWSTLFPISEYPTLTSEEFVTGILV